MHKRMNLPTTFWLSMRSESKWKSEAPAFFPRSSRHTPLPLPTSMQARAIAGLTNPPEAKLGLQETRLQARQLRDQIPGG